MQPFYVTTAIDYGNSRPHLGHSYEKVVADVVARYQRLRGKRVFFQVGIDEHSMNVARKAQELGVVTREYCAEWRRSIRNFSVSYRSITSD